MIYKGRKVTNLPQQKQDPSLDSAFFCSEKYRSNGNVALNWPQVLEGTEMTDFLIFISAARKKSGLAGVPC